MQSKSSTALAFISILSILIVLFIALSNVEDAPVRKPFPSAEADAGVETTPAKEPAAENDFTMESTGDENIITWIHPEGDPEQRTSTKTETVSNPVTATVVPSESLQKNVTNELLDRVGYKNIVVKPLPFNGRLFDEFDLSMLSYLDIVEKKVVQLDDGNENEVLRVYEFNFSDSIGSQEIYDFLKAKIKDELGVTVNESNQFGLQSFYINFHEPRERAFLIVKTRSNVYALSYPKATDGDKTHFEMVSRLLTELI